MRTHADQKKENLRLIGLEWQQYERRHSDLAKWLDQMEVQLQATIDDLTKRKVSKALLSQIQ